MYKFEPIVKTISQAKDYFDRNVPMYDNKYWVRNSSNINNIINTINDGLPLPQINYNIKDKTIINADGTDTYITLVLLMDEFAKQTLYMNIETGLITDIIDGKYTIPIYIFFDNIKLLKYQRTIENINDELIDKIDKIYAKFKFYKVIINELYQI